MAPVHGDLAMVSTAVTDVSDVRLILFDEADGTGWWVLAGSDLPEPAAENLVSGCLHCLLDVIGPLGGAGMDTALADLGANSDGVGVALLEGGVWVTGERAREELER